MKNKVITISREFGSGGFYIGELVAKHLGIPFYDKEIIDRIAEESGLVKSYIERLSEYAPSKSIFAYSFVGRSVTGESIEDYIMNIQRRVIMEVAADGPCVIVGRSADYILRRQSNVVNVFIQGDHEEKVKRVMEFKGICREEAERLIKDTDKKRSINYKYYTGRNWGDRKNYTLMINSTRVGMERTAEIIATLYG